MNSLLGKKQNMSRRFDRMGFLVPVTSIVAEPNVVLVKKTDSVVVGMGEKKRAKKTENAYFKAAGFSPRFVKEIKVAPKGEPRSETERAADEKKPGDKINVSIFESGDEVKITGTTKGRGFAGVIKRHGFHGGPKTHGQSDRHRAPGSIGAGTTPGRVYKGKKMAGHMGAAQLTTTGIEVIEVDANTNTILVKGAVPGSKNGLLVIEKTGKVKGYTPPPAPNEEKQAEKEAEAEEEAKEARAAQEGEPRSETERAEAKGEDKAEGQGDNVTEKKEDIKEEKQAEVKEAKKEEENAG